MITSDVNLISGYLPSTVDDCSIGGAVPVTFSLSLYKIPGTKAFKSGIHS